MTSTRLYWLTIISYLGLGGLMTLWITVLSPPQQMPISLVLLLCVVPLLLPLRGILHGKPYTYSWTPFLMLLYFTHGVMELFANSAVRTLATLEVCLSCIIFFSCTLYVRAYNRENCG